MELPVVYSGLKNTRILDRSYQFGQAIMHFDNHEDNKDPYYVYSTGEAEKGYQLNGLLLFCCVVVITS